MAERFLLWFQAKELSSLTGAQVLLLVTSETGNIYDFSTPKFSKVLETFKTWYRSSAKDSQRVEVTPLIPSLPQLQRNVCASLTAPALQPASRVVQQAMSMIGKVMVATEVSPKCLKVRCVEFAGSGGAQTRRISRCSGRRSITP